MRRPKLLGMFAELATEGVLFVLRPRPFRITQANGARIKPGMTAREVRAILGPPREHRATETEPFATDALVGSTIGETAGLRFDDWVNNDTWIRVVFDEKGRVVYRLSSMLRTVDHGPSDNVAW